MTARSTSLALASACSASFSPVPGFMTSTGPCRDYRSAKHDDPARNATYNATLRQHGIFKSPGKLYPSLAITPVDLEKTEYAIERAVQSIALT
jgi:hypothetical protein